MKSKKESTVQDGILRQSLAEGLNLLVSELTDGRMTQWMPNNASNGIRFGVMVHFRIIITIAKGLFFAGVESLTRLRLLFINIVRGKG